MQHYTVKEIGELASKSSTLFELSNNDTKKKYIQKNINLILECMKLVPGFKGAFGTGYPFYAIGSNMQYSYPIIEEQIRYNDELKTESENSAYINWHCADCLETDGKNMPDLKQICKTCDKIENGLKPRKVINRLPDLDLWFVCEDDMIDSSKILLQYILEKNQMFPSDIAVVKTIENVHQISQDISNGKMPNIYLPLDVHIIGISELKNLIDLLPVQIMKYINGEDKAYLPIWPESLRKKWGKDDEPYNFIFDFIYSFTPMEMDYSLNKSICDTRKVLATMLEGGFENLLDDVSSPAVKRRNKNQQLQQVYKDRYQSWRNNNG